MQILIVEDEIYARQSLKKQVTDFDSSFAFEILEASNGKDGLSLFKQYFPEIVILDIKMPGMDGLSLLAEIMELRPSTKVLMVSGYAYFEYSQQAINCGAAGYLLKPIHDDDFSAVFGKILEQNTKLNKSKEELQILRGGDSMSHSIYQHIVSDTDHNTAIEGDITDLVFDKIFDKYRVVDIYFRNSDDYNPVLAIEDCKNVLLQQYMSQFKAISINKQLFVVVVKEHVHIAGAISALYDRLNAKSDVCCVGVSNSANGCEQLSNAYQQALTAIKGRLLQGKNIVYYNEISFVDTNEDIVPTEEFSVLKVFLDRGDVLKAVDTVNNMIDILFNNKLCSLSSVENFLIQLTACLYDVVQKHLSHEMQTINLSFSLLSYGTPDELKKEIVRQINTLCDTIPFEKTIHSDNVMNIVTEYINQNYNKEISLQYLAEKVVFLNHTYLSHLIREKTGKSYSTYLKEIRINKAKELLCDNRLTITEVATLCGYNDTSQFIQTFKKEVGMTPKKVQDYARRYKTNAKNEQERNGDSHDK